MMENETNLDNKLLASRVDIEFEDLNYSIKGNDAKQILNSISGKFLSGELTAILGPSGSGKTTLLNILAGYIFQGVTGSIQVNEQPRHMKTFRKLCRYIMQEDIFQPHLTLHESIMVAAKLKLGDKVTIEQKNVIIDEILKILGLDQSLNTRIEQLSGGQRKRLSIAQELISNPPIIFLDEPTSGLDSVAAMQCMEILRRLTSQGRTVICTIHQPSIAILEQFDQLYFIANGMCVYNGSTPNIMPFLTSVQLECPITYSPAEFIVETVQMSSELVQPLVDAIGNGKINKRDPKSSTHEQGTNTSTAFACSGEIWESVISVDFPTSFWMQFYIISCRMIIQMKRNKLRIWIQLFHHAMVGLVFGILFYNVGNDAELALANFKFCLFSLFFFVYTYIMSPVLLFPFEVEILKREYFNNWYSLKAYFLALTFQNIPLLMTLGLAFTVITYFMTNQPLEVQRFFGFALVVILVAIASEGVGLAVGSIFNVTNGAIVAPAVSAPSMILCIYGMGYGAKIEPAMKILMGTSYVRYGLVAVGQAIFADREQFECLEESLICIYRDPKHLLRDFGMLDASYSLNILGLVLFALLFRLIAFIALRYRLSIEFSHTVANYFSKLIGTT